MLLALVCNSGQLQRRPTGRHPALCTAPVLCPLSDRRHAEVCSFPDGSSGALCTPPSAAARLGRPLAGPRGDPARHLPVSRQTLSAPSGSFSSAAAERRASLAWGELREREEQLMADLHRPGTVTVDLAGPHTGTAGTQQRRRFRRWAGSACRDWPPFRPSETRRLCEYRIAEKPCFRQRLPFILR